MLSRLTRCGTHYGTGRRGPFARRPFSICPLLNRKLDFVCRLWRRHLPAAGVTEHPPAAVVLPLPRDLDFRVPLVAGFVVWRRRVVPWIHPAVFSCAPADFASRAGRAGDDDTFAVPF